MAKIKSIDKNTKGLLNWESQFESTVKKGEYTLGVNDRLSSLVLDVSSTEEKSATINLEGSETASLKVITGGIVNSDATLYANKVNINGVDASVIYGGAVLSTTADLTKATLSTNLGATTRYIDAGVDVKGTADLTINGVTATTVYGGGAGYGSTVEAVNLTFKNTNKIGTVYGGGQKGAVVTGDVNITVERTGVSDEGGRIGAIYGGGDNATVKGDVNITITGTNAISVGTISGSGRGSKARVEGDRTLTIADYSGKLTATIKNFDLIQFEGSTAVTLTQSQNSTIKSAEYEFVINEAAFGQSANAMLTWSNSSVDTGNFYISIDVDDDYVANGFEGKKIYYSSYLTEKSAANISVRAINEDGSYSDIDDSAYTLSFVADVDSKGDAKQKGGYVVLSYTGSNVTVDADSDEDVVLTSAADRVTVKGDIVDVNVDAAAGNDRVSVQADTQMKGDIYLGSGSNTLNVQANAEVTGSVVVDANSTNTINVNGTVSQIEGGDATTKNIVNINNNEAIGFYRDGVFFEQDLTFANDTEDTVVVSTASDYDGNINFGKGKDTLVLNTAVTGTITSDDGNDVIVANKSGVTIDATALRLTGTDNALVVANGVNAKISGVAVGDYMESDGTFARGIYLGQNALIGDLAGNIAVSSFNGDFNLEAGQGDLTVLAAKQLDATEDAELIARIGNYYKAGTGVKGNIDANGNGVTLKEGAIVNGTIYDANVTFEGNAGGENLFFENATIDVKEGVTATVGSVLGLNNNDHTSTDEHACFEDDLERITLSNDAQVKVENGALPIGEGTVTKLTIAGNITKDTAFTGNVALKGKVKDTAEVALTDATVYFAKDAEIEGNEFAFTGSNYLAIASAKEVELDNKKLTVNEGATIKAAVLEDGHLRVGGIANGEESKIKSADVTLADNAMFTVGDTTETANWTKSFTGVGTAGKVAFRDGSQLVKGIALATTAEITLSGSETARALVKNDDTSAAITLSANEGDKLTLAKADVYGAIDAANTTADADEITLTDVTVKGIKEGATPGAAITLDEADTLVANNATIVGDLEGGIVTLNSSTVDGAVNGNVLVLASTIGEINGGSTIVTGTDEDGNVVDGITTIKKFTNGMVSITDDAVVQIDGTFGADKEGNITALRVQDAQLKGDVAVKAVAKNTGSTVVVADATLGAITQQAGSSLVELLNAAAETGAITQGFDATLGINATAASVSAGLTLENNYKNYDESTSALIDEDAADFPIVNQAMTVEAISRKTGDITETSAQNDVNAYVEIAANGLYQGVTDAATGTKVTNFDDDTTEDADLANSQLHKPAVINVGTVNAEFGAIAQTGDENSVVAGFAYDSEGEADVTVGKSTMTMGAITQYSDYVDPETPLEGEANVVDLSIAVASGEDEPAGQQSTLTLDDIALTVNGKISQTAFANDNYLNLSTYRYNELEEVPAAEGEGKKMGVINDEGKTQTITVNAEKDEAGNYGTAIEMFAWNGNNAINLEGNVTVNGDIKVGGVVKFDEDGNQYTEDASFGDRVAVYNKLSADAGTVTVNGNVSLIGLNNYLNITNSTDETNVKFANEVYVAGNNNKLTVGTGVETSNIHFYNLKDYDKFGQDGYEIGLESYTNLLEVNGTVSEVIVDNVNSDDTIIVTGGTVTGDVVTKNGKDFVYVGGYSYDEGQSTYAAQGDSLIGGNVTMGAKDAASGKNVLYVEGYDDDDADDPVLYTAKIGGNVSLYSNEKNELTVGSDGTVGTLDSEGKVVNEVMLEASVKPEEYEDEETVINELQLASDAVVNAKVALTGDASNKVVLRNTATVAGKLTMSGAYNVVTSNSNSQATLADIEQTATAMTEPGEYNNGIVTDEGLIVKGGIVQEANVADVMEDETVTEAKYGAANYIELNNGAHSLAHPEHQTVKVDGAIKQTSDGNNYLLIKGAIKGSEITNTATNPPDYSEYNKDTFTEGSFLATIADVTQTSTNDTTTTVVNNIELTNTNAGALAQVAAGKAINQVTINDAGHIELYAYDETGFKFDSSKTTYKKTEIASVSQTGFGNTVDVGYDNKIGSVTIDAQTVSKVLKEGDQGYDAQYKTTVNTTVDSYANSYIKFGFLSGGDETSNIEVGDITFKSQIVYDTKQLVAGTEEEKAVITKTAAKASGVDIQLNDTTAANITSGEGKDYLTLKGKSVVTGTIDLGSGTSEVADDTFDNTDTLNISSADVDLSEATIANVETISSTSVNTVDVKAITGQEVAGIASLNTIKATNINVDSITNNVVTIAAQDADTAVAYTFKDGIGQYSSANSSYVGYINGATKAGVTDTLTIGDVSATTAGDSTIGKVAVSDIDKVVFAKGAEASDNTMWYRTTGDTTVNKSISFTFNQKLTKDDASTAAEENKITIGKFNTDAGAGYEKYTAKDITFYNGTDAFTSTAATGAAVTNGSTWTRTVGTGASAYTETLTYSDGTLTFSTTQPS